MKEALKTLLKSVGIYHPLQSRYREFINFLQRSKYRFTFKEYNGIGYTCNGCGRTYAQFADSYPMKEDKEAITRNHVIAGYGKNIICPGCLSTARDRLVLAWLQLWKLKDVKVLHFSPERPVSNFLRKTCEVISADLEPGYYRNIDSFVQRENALALSFPPDTFDVLIANHILEHIPSDIIAMKEFYRVLKPGGRAILQVPYMNDLPTLESCSIPDQLTASRLYGQKDHVRIYNLEDYIDRLRSVGFLVERVRYKDMQAFHHFGTQESEDFLLITKPA